MDFTIEELSMNAWPAIKTVLYDGWVIRLANGYSNRANSINPIYPSKISLGKKLAYCEELFQRHNLLTTYKLTDCEEHKAIDRKLERMKYQKIHETSIQVCNIQPSIKDTKHDVVVSDVFNDQWIKSVVNFNKIEKKHILTFKTILSNIAVEKIVVHKEAAGKIIGCGYCTIENNYAGVFDIVVNEKFRGKGYGREIVETILSEAAKRGAKKSYLQVMLNNPAALHLYEKLGYREIYQYWYRKAKL